MTAKKMFKGDPKKGGHVKNDVAMLQLKDKIANLYLGGKSQYLIGKTVGLSQPAVHSHLKKLKEEWKNKFLTDVNEKMWEEVAKIDRLEEIATDAWLRSCVTLATKATKSETVPEKVLDDEEPMKGKKPKMKRTGRMVEVKRTLEEKVVEQGGNPAYLDKIQWCIETRLKIMGRLSPREEKDNSDRIVIVNFDTMMRVPPPQGSLGQLSHLPLIQANDPVEDELAKLASLPPPPRNGAGNGNGKH